MKNPAKKSAWLHQQAGHCQRRDQLFYCLLLTIFVFNYDHLERPTISSHPPTMFSTTRVPFSHDVIWHIHWSHHLLSFTEKSPTIRDYLRIHPMFHLETLSLKPNTFVCWILQTTSWMLRRLSSSGSLTLWLALYSLTQTWKLWLLGVLPYLFSSWFIFTLNYILDLDPYF